MPRYDRPLWATRCGGRHLKGRLAERSRPVLQYLALMEVNTSELNARIAAVLAPLIEADQGELYMVPDPEERLHIHLAGQFSGCPGNTLVIRRLVRPLLRSADGSFNVKVTSGYLVPPGAIRITARPAPEADDPATQS